MEEVCRVCMIDCGPLEDIFDPCLLPDKKCSIADIINQLSSSELQPDDKLSKKICGNCTRDAQIAFGFKQRYEKSHQLLTLRRLAQEDDDLIESLEAEDWKLVQEDVTVDQGECQKASRQSKRQALSRATAKNIKDSRQKPKNKLSKVEKPKYRRKKQYQCDLCGKQFVNRCDMKAHGNVHTGLRPYKCDLCSKDFTWPQGLRAHRMTHTGKD